GDVLTATLSDSDSSDVLRHSPPFPLAGICIMMPRRQRDGKCLPLPYHHHPHTSIHVHLHTNDRPHLWPRRLRHGPVAEISFLACAKTVRSWRWK
ncbi:hypothetical protein B0H12DRAFT_1156913, partial [Mycena haematopus]